MKEEKIFLTLSDIEREYKLKRREVKEIVKQNGVKVLTGGNGKMYRILRRDFEELLKINEKEG